MGKYVNLFSVFIVASCGFSLLIVRNVSKSGYHLYPPLLEDREWVIPGIVVISTEVITLEF